jgi:hypothetical protein
MKNGDKKMDLRTLAEKISDNYADAVLGRGPMSVFMNECATGYIHSFHIRGLLAHHQATGNVRWLDAAKAWTEFSIKMQGTYGHSDAYNMGYLYDAEDGVPKSWFVADTTDQAVGLLDVAMLLSSDDPLYERILESVSRFDEYIQQWNLGENGFALGYMDGENLNKESYHCAVARCVSHYAAMSVVYGKTKYLEIGKTLTRHMLKNDDFNSMYHGAPSTNRCYASFALADAYHVLAAEDDALRKAILTKVAEEIVPWAIENQTPEGYWIHDRYEGYQPGAAHPLDKRGFGTYSWGVLFGLRVFSRLLPENEELTSAIAKSYDYMTTNLDPESVNRWGHHAWATVAIAAELYPENILPMGRGCRHECTNNNKLNYS